MRLNPQDGVGEAVLPRHDALFIVRSPRTSSMLSLPASTGA